MNFYNCTLQLHLDLLLPAQVIGIQPLQPCFWHIILGKNDVENTLKKVVPTTRHTRFMIIRIRQCYTAADNYIGFIWHKRGQDDRSILNYDSNSVVPQSHFTLPVVHDPFAPSDYNQLYHDEEYQQGNLSRTFT
ncbi:hypothetical protein CRYUN_Cryun08bG0127000 [Craigia yunnanensis]